MPISNVLSLTSFLKVNVDEQGKLINQTMELTQHQLPHHLVTVNAQINRLKLLRSITYSKEPLYELQVQLLTLEKDRSYNGNLDILAHILESALDLAMQTMPPKLVPDLKSQLLTSEHPDELTALMNGEPIDTATWQQFNELVANFPTVVGQGPLVPWLDSHLLEVDLGPVTTQQFQPQQTAIAILNELQTFEITSILFKLVFNFHLLVTVKEKRQFISELATMCRVHYLHAQQMANFFNFYIDQIDAMYRYRNGQWSYQGHLIANEQTMINQIEAQMIVGIGGK